MPCIILKPTIRIQMPNLFYEFLNFSSAELLDNEKFISLINERNNNSLVQSYWSEIVRDEAVDLSEIIFAATIVERSSGSEVSINPEMKQSAWMKISQAVGIGYSYSEREMKKPFYMKWAIAASVLLVLGIGAILFYTFESKDKTLEWTTASDKAEVIHLPDLSVVKLNENSTLRYNKNWQKDDAREVWIDGDAEFDIRHINKDTSKVSDHERFIVHIGKDMDVEVLGTVFNVKRSDSIIVVELKSGSVKINYLKNHTSEYAFLRPLEKAELNLTTRELVRYKFAAEHASKADSSADKEIELYNTSVKEIISLIEKNYNLKIDVTDADILSRKLNGSFPIYSEKDIWFVLINLLDVNIEVLNDGTLLLKPR